MRARRAVGGGALRGGGCALDRRAGCAPPRGGGSGGGRAWAIEPRACDIAERSHGSGTVRDFRPKNKRIGVRFISKQHSLPEKKGPFWILTNSDVTTICMINYCGYC